MFQDLSNKWSFLTRASAKTKETIKWEDGKEYPLIKVHISSSSHPFFTGQEKLLDIEGRVDKFKARAAAAKKRRDELNKKQSAPKQEATKKESAKPETQKIGNLKTTKTKS